MKVVNSDHWKAFLLMSIIVPVSLVVGFKFFNSSMNSVVVAESVVLEPVVWSRERPCRDAVFAGDSELQLSFRDEELAFEVLLYAREYHVRYFKFGPTVFIGLTNITASVTEGFVQSLLINFSDVYAASDALFFWTNPDKGTSGELSNLTLNELGDGFKRSWLLGGTTKAFMSLQRLGCPDRVSFGEECVEYHFNSLYNYTHEVSMFFEVVYFNGTAYKKVVQPVSLVLFPDPNVGFDTAEEIHVGESKIGYLDDLDNQDFYKIWLEEAQKINITLTFDIPNNFDLCVFDSGDLENPIAVSPYNYGEPESLVLEVASPCLLYIKTVPNGGAGGYVLNVEPA